MDYSEDELGSDREDYLDDVPEAYDLFNDEADEAEEAEEEIQSGKGESKDQVKTEKETDKDLEKKPKVKRIVRNPRVTLNFDTLRGPNGLSALKKLFADFKFKGTNHELEDLTKIMQILQQWMCFKLNPGYDFESTLAQLENLGKKKIVQTLMKKYRLGIDDWGESKSDNEDNTNNSKQQMIVDDSNDFEKELQELIANADSDELSHDEDNSLPKQNDISQQSQSEVVLTQEQLERIAKNRKLAEERRRKRLSTQNVMDVDKEGNQNNETELQLDNTNLTENSC